MNKTITLSQADANVVAAILKTHAMMQDQGAANVIEIQARLMRDDPGVEMIDTLASQVDDLELDAQHLRELAEIFA